MPIYQIIALVRFHPAVICLQELLDETHARRAEKYRPYGLFSRFRPPRGVALRVALAPIDADPVAMRTRLL